MAHAISDKISCTDTYIHVAVDAVVPLMLTRVLGIAGRFHFSKLLTSNIQVRCDAAFYDATYWFKLFVDVIFFF